MMIYTKNKTNGFILIEVLIAIALFAVFASAMISMILGSLVVLEKGADYSYAANLSQESLEAIKVIENESWNQMIYDKSALGFEDGWFLAGEGTEERIGKFNRYIEFSPVFRDENKNIVSSTSLTAMLDVNSLNIESVVSWENNNKELSLSNALLITNWQSSIWEQNSWTGVSGQEIILDENSFYSSFNIQADDTLDLLEIATGTLAVNGYLESSFFGPVDIGVFSTISWEENIPSECPDCYVKVQIKTAEDYLGEPANWSNTWCGPEGEDGDEEDFFDSSEGNLISIEHNGDKWIKYKIILGGDGLNTPEIENLKIYYK
ncbi:MAG: prepilin-type N-terminal cleavage/methylation domain-containing protein [Fusobacteriaceae bacterium]|nr:prepilin-type N-terminal cleavage/methylation domain-containing protein [Fusobacteriaceae bacterium]